MGKHMKKAFWYTLATYLAFMAVLAVSAHGAQITYAPQYATQAEAQAGTATNKIMTPQRTQDFQTAMAATTGEAQAGSNTTHWMSPATTLSEIQTFANFPAGIIIGYNHCGSTALITTAGTALPIDDTQPLSAEGDSVLTCAYSAKVSNSKILVVFQGSISGSAAQAACYLRVDSGNAVDVQLTIPNSTATAVPVNMLYPYAPGDTSSHTYEVKCGTNAGAALTFNGFSAARKFGGFHETSITIQEVKQ